MISTLLLPLLFTTAPAPAPAASSDDPPIQLWINERRFLPGDGAKVQVRTEYDGYLLVFHVDPEGRLRVLFPIDPDKDNFVRGRKKYEVRGRGGREAFQSDGKGRGAVYAAVSRDPVRFDGYVMGDHWDYKALNASRFPDDPEPDLNELVQRMAQSSFDYDMITYEVVDRSSYASDYYPRYSYGSAYDDPWCYRFSCGRPYYGSPFSLSIGLFFGRPYRRYYYDPYFYAYDPFYNPFFYDPYYYAPTYYPRYVYPRRHFFGFHDRYHYWDRHRSFSRPYTPYRFRAADGFTAGYRDRRPDIRRSVNTVYNPPISRFRDPATATPARRVIEGAGAELPSGVAPRRTVGHSQPMRRDGVEARRAREPEEPRRTVQAEPRGRERSAPEASPARREVETPRHDERREPRLERRREEPRQAERAPEARPQPRQVERAPAREAPRREVQPHSSPPPDRGVSRAQGRSSGGSDSRGSRPSNGGGRRRN